MENQTTYKSMLKSELAACAGVSARVMRRWLVSDRAKLAELGVLLHDKYINPAGVKYICEKYVIDLK
jgi:predicted DNA-binding protein (UPF0251 family)